MFGIAALGFLQPYALLVKIGLALVLVAVCAYAWHLFVDHYRDQGRAEVRQKYTALLFKCDTQFKGNPDQCATDWDNLRLNNVQLTADKAACHAGLKTQSDSIKKQGDLSAEIRDAANKIITAGAANAAKNSATPYVKELEAKMLAPRAATKEKECENVFGTVNNAADRWLRYYGPDAAGAARPKDRAGTGAGGDVLRIGQ